MDETILAQLDESLHECIEACEACVAACEHAANQALDEGGLYAVVRACRDGADLSALLVRFMARHAALTPELSEVCAKACDVCAAECDAVDAAWARSCAEVCRTCRDALAELAA